VPQIRDYPQATSIEATDAFVLDRVGTGTMYVEGLDTAANRVATYVVDGAGSVLTTGIAGQLYFPFACTILGATLLADQSGSVVVDIWKTPYSGYPPDSGDSIVASAPPTITTAEKSQDTTLAGWTVAIDAGDTLMFNIDSVASITRLTIALQVFG